MSGPRRASRPGYTIAREPLREVRTRLVASIERADGWGLDMAIITRGESACLSLRTCLDRETRSRVQIVGRAELEALEAACREYRAELGRRASAEVPE